MSTHHSIPPCGERPELNVLAPAEQTHFHQTVVAVVTIDPETGYQDALECECRPCPECAGEGGGTSWCDPGCLIPNVNGSRGCPGHDWTCSKCNGTGKDSEDCGVHGAQPVCSEGGALRLGGEWEADEVPDIPKIAARVQMPSRIAEVA